MEEHHWTEMKWSAEDPIAPTMVCNYRYLQLEHHVDLTS